MRCRKLREEQVCGEDLNSVLDIMFEMTIIHPSSDIE